jgi:hypothetical protein
MSHYSPECTVHSFVSTFSDNKRQASCKVACSAPEWPLAGIAAAIILTFCGFTTAYASAPAPNAPQVAGGQFTVNTTNDNTTFDSYLTLREAILLVNGGTGAGGLNRALSTSEQNLAHDCIFNLGRITSGCGPGYANTIVFLSSLSPSSIALLTPLPPITTTGTTIDGSGLGPTIAMGSVAGGGGLVVTSDSNTIKNVNMGNSAAFSLRIDGNNNTVSGVTVYTSKLDNVLINGNNNVLTGTWVGSSAEANACVAGSNVKYGIHLQNGASNNVIEYGGVACNTNGGIYVDGSAGNSNVIGPNVLVGVSKYLAHNLSNSGPGVTLDSNWSQVLSTTLMYNTDGIRVGGSFNVIGGSVIRKNSGDGIYLYGFASYNRIGMAGILGPQLGNGIGSNSGWGIDMFGNTVSYNWILDNMIGSKLTNLVSDGNTLGGVRIYAGHDNQLGDNLHLYGWNYIVANSGDGVLITTGAHNNSVNHNLIGQYNYSNSGDGIAIDNGAHDNTIGGLSDWLKNDEEDNAGNGIALYGTATTTNTIAGDLTAYNSQNGVLLDGARINSITNIYDQNNLRNGILITGSALLNMVNGGRSEYNQSNGIELGGATYFNVISGTIIGFNTVNGIDERDGASGNQWTKLNMHDDGQKGIDTHLGVPSPVQITSVFANGVITIAHGTASPSTLLVSTIVEIYVAAPNASGNPEGRTYLVTAPVDTAGNWAQVLPPGSGVCLTAFQTESYFASTSGEFSPETCRSMLPFVTR